MAPRGGFRIGAMRTVILSPRELLPWCVRRRKVGIGGERAGGRTPLRYRVKRRGRENAGRVGENAVEREATVSAVGRGGE